MENSTFLESFKEDSSKTRTLNGAVAYNTTSDACLDIFATIGGMRYQRCNEQVKLFEKAYIENPELAMKLLFYIRDIRKGMGERSTFRNIIRAVANRWPDSVRKNVHLISEYGRFDDLLCLLGTKVEDTVVEVIDAQLKADLAALDERLAGNTDAHVSLLGKWMPSINTSSKTTRTYAKRLAKRLHMNPYTYRKTLSKLRANIGLTERYLSDNKIKKIKYPAVPASAMLKYSKAFFMKDEKNFKKYLSEVKQHTSSIHCDTIFPYQLVKPFTEPKNIPSYKAYNSFLENSTADFLNTMWDNLPNNVATGNSITVVDVSASMFCGCGTVTPVTVAVALGLYHAERCQGAFHNHFITFESNPHLIKVKGNNLMDKIDYILQSPWGGSTDLSKVFKLILRTAVHNKVPQSDLPSTLFIISDMEFNIACNDPSKTVYDDAKKLYETFGYELPAVVFMNVSSWQEQVPVRANTRGAALASGFGTSTFSHKFDGNVTPMDHMLRVLNSERYAAIHA